MTPEQLQWQVDTVLGLALAASVVLGFVMHRSHFCAMGALSDWWVMGHTHRVCQWLLAIAVAMLGFAALVWWGGLSPLNTIYNTPRLPWLSYLLGGCLFGCGMVLASGCAGKSLVRLGAGNLKSLVVLIVMGISALSAMRGLPAVWRVQWFDRVDAPWGAGPFMGQWLVQAVAPFIELSLPLALCLAALLVATALIAGVLRQPNFCNAHNLLTGVGVGVLVSSLWWFSGQLGWLAEHPDTLESVFLTTASGRMEAVSLVGPAGYWLDALLYFSDGTKRLNYGMAAFAGVALGAALSAWRAGTFRWEGFANTADLKRHLLGGVLMGLGGVLALGCTFGQGISGLSTLNLGSLLAALGMVLGAVLTLQWQLSHE